jgi:glyoxylase-like metal-dependent hydrolase (beta-lactamase superfamily II)
MAYRDSLRRTREFDVDVVFPGHGVPIDDHRRLIDARLAEIAQRSEQIAAILSGGPMTAYEVSERIWPNASLTQPDLTLSEVLGHADVLREAGRLEEHEHDDAVRLVLTS